MAKRILRAVGLFFLCTTVVNGATVLAVGDSIVAGKPRTGVLAETWYHMSNAFNRDGGVSGMYMPISGGIGFTTHGTNRMTITDNGISIADKLYLAPLDTNSWVSATTNASGIVTDYVFRVNGTNKLWSSF